MMFFCIREDLLPPGALRGRRRPLMRALRAGGAA